MFRQNCFNISNIKKKCFPIKKEKQTQDTEAGVNKLQLGSRIKNAGNKKQTQNQDEHCE